MSPLRDEPPLFRVSLRGIFLVTLVVAVVVVCWASNDRLWSAVLTSLNVWALVASGVAAIYASGNLRAFCVGFLLGDGLITLCEFVPAVGRPLLQRMLAWQLWHPNSPSRVASASVERAYVGALLTGWLYGTLAGLLAMWWRNKKIRASAATEVDG